MEEKKYKN